MSHVCILTDACAQFSNTDFPGAESVFIFAPYTPEGFTKLALGPKSTLSNSRMRADRTHEFENFKQAMLTLSQHYNEFCLLLTSSRFDNHSFQKVVHAVETLQGKVSIQLIDTPTTALGLGHLVQMAAKNVAEGAKSTHIVRLLQKQMAHIYTIFCTKDLTNLSLAGGLDPAHAVVGEMLGIAPVMILENGHLIATQKVRNARHLVDVLIEYIEEFYQLKQIFIHRATPIFGGEMNQLRERLASNYPETLVTESISNPALQTMLGPRSLCMVVIDDIERGRR